MSLLFNSVVSRISNPTRPTAIFGLVSAAYALNQGVGTKAACEALASPRETFYRHMSCVMGLLGNKIPSCSRFGSYKAKETDRDRYPPYGACLRHETGKGVSIPIFF